MPIVERNEARMNEDIGFSFSYTHKLYEIGVLSFQMKRQGFDEDCQQRCRVKVVFEFIVLIFYYPRLYISLFFKKCVSDQMKREDLDEGRQRSLHRQPLMEQSGGALFVQTSYVIFVTGPRDQKGRAGQGRGHVGRL